MVNSRALFASAGASAALVAAFAFALLAVSAVLAFGGGAGDLQASAARPALILDVSASVDPGIFAAGSRSGTSAPVVLRARPRPLARPSRPAAQPAEPAAVAGPEARAAVEPIVRAPAAIVADDVQPAVAPPAAEQPRTGDAVRRVGDDLSSSASKTGAALSDAAAPLGPPVSQAVQDVLDKLAIVLRRTTGGVGGTLDKILPPKP